MIVDIIKKIISQREEIDLKENAVDSEHDLPVYHRIQQLLTTLNENLDQFDAERTAAFRSLGPIVLQFDRTLGLEIGILLMKISHNQEELENALKFLEENLPEDFFRLLLIKLGELLSKKGSCSFIEQLSVHGKLELAQWFIKEKKRPLFVQYLLDDDLFHQFGDDRQVCQDLLRELRSSEDLFLRRNAMTYIVPWKEDGNADDRKTDEQMIDSEESDKAEMS